MVKYKATRIKLLRDITVCMCPPTGVNEQPVAEVFEEGSEYDVHKEEEITEENMNFKGKVYFVIRKPFPYYFMIPETEVQIA